MKGVSKQSKQTHSLDPVVPGDAGDAALDLGGVALRAESTGVLQCAASAADVESNVGCEN